MANATLPDVSRVPLTREKQRTDPATELLKLYKAFSYNFQPPYAIDFDRLGSQTGV